MTHFAVTSEYQLNLLIKLPAKNDGTFFFVIGTAFFIVLSWEKSAA